MIKRYIKSILCPDRVNRLQVDVDLTDIKQIRRVSRMLYDAIPEEERFFSPDFFTKKREAYVQGPSLLIFDDMELAEDDDEHTYQASRKTHAKLFEVFDYLHAHPTEAKYLSVRRLQRLTGVSKSTCHSAVTAWAKGVNNEYALYLEREKRDS